MYTRQENSSFKIQQTFICEVCDKQEAVLMSCFTSYTGWIKQNKITNPFKNQLGSNFLIFLLMLAATFYSPSAWKRFYVQKKCSSVAYKGRELHTSTVTWLRSAVDIQLFSKKKKEKEVRTRTEYRPFFSSCNTRDMFSYCVLILFCFHSIPLLFKNQAVFKKDKSIGYIKRIYRQFLGNSLANIMNSLIFTYRFPACNDHKNRWYRLNGNRLKKLGKKQKRCFDRLTDTQETIRLAVCIMQPVRSHLSMAGDVWPANLFCSGWNASCL